MNAPPDPLRTVLRALAADQQVAPALVTEAFGVVMRGEATPIQIAALLMGLRVQGESPAVIAAVARALRAAMVRLPAPNPDMLVDTCGTGGGSISTFNISTAAALVAAGAGVRVAKHGNRSFTSRSGSADVLEALGVRADPPVAVMQRALATAGIAFMYAPTMHPAMRHVGAVRRELGVPTVMNVVGPLANPAMAGRQVVGVADAPRAPLIAGALADLGAVHALVVHGEPGLDEISPLGLTHVYEIGRDSTNRPGGRSGISDTDGRPPHGASGRSTRSRSASPHAIPRSWLAGSRRTTRGSCWRCSPVGGRPARARRCCSTRARRFTSQGWMPRTRPPSNARARRSTAAWDSSRSTGYGQRTMRDGPA